MPIPDLLQTALDYAGQAVLLTGQQLLLLLGPSLLLAGLMHLVSERLQIRAGELLGHRLHIWLTAPGTVVHELGHVLFCILFGHQIREVALFRPRPDGVLGYVKHSWNRGSLYQNAGNFFIGTGPIWLGSAAIFALGFALLGPEFLAPLRALRLEAAAFLSLAGGIGLAAQLWQTLLALFALFVGGELYRDWRFWLYLYLLFCIGSHVTLSAADLDGTRAGLLVILSALLLFNLCTLWLGDFALHACLVVAQYGLVINALLLFALILNTLIAGLILLVTALR